MMNKKINNLVLSIIIIYNNLFFVVTSLVSYSYTSSDESPIYIIISILFFIITLIHMIDLFATKGIKKIEIFVLCILIMFLLFAGFDFLRYGWASQRYKDMLLYFGAYSITATMTAIIVNKRDCLFDLCKFFELFMIIIALTCCLLLYRYGIHSDYLKSFLSLNYQSCSYNIAFSAGLNLLFISNGRLYERYKFTTFKFYKSFSWILLLIQIIGCIFSGGRGGMLLLVVYFIYFGLSNYHKVFTVKYFFYTIFLVLIGLALFKKIYGYLIKFSSFNINIDRILNYSDPSRINIIYPLVIKYIKEKPFSGWGIWGYLNSIIGTVYSYPHNIVLEVLLQGGIIYFIVFFSLLFLSLYKLHLLVKTDNRYQLIVVLILYPLVNLLFSGSYLIAMLFWFCMTNIFLINNKQVDTIRKIS